MTIRLASVSFLPVLRTWLEQQLNAKDLKLKATVYFMSETEQEGVALLADLSGVPVEYELPGYEKAQFQVIVRAKDFRRGDDLARRVMRILAIENVNISAAVKVNYVRPRHQPLPFQKSKGGFHEFSINFNYCAVIALQEEA